MEAVVSGLANVALRFVPRLLTQACRDPHAPFYGCFDRNWWHYKIRDFPSIILQQGGYAVYLAGQLAEFSEMSRGLDDLASGSVRFWTGRAEQHGAFEEYYPWEQGYPPLAFASLSAAKLCLSGVCDTEAAMPGLEIAARQLVKRFEPQAANQQVAGLAALASLRSISPKLVADRDFDSIAKRTLALQHQEGWFSEYDGPDLGYLTVTLDCLWDLFDQTGNPEFVASASRAFAFIEWFVSSPPHRAGLHNARNTDYLVPYGLTRFLGLGSEWAIRARGLLNSIYADVTGPDHFFSAVDDRYVSHYIGHSVLRAILMLRKIAPLSAEAKTATPPAVPEIDTRYLAGSGHWTDRKSILVSGKKGGIFTLTLPKGTAADFGWIVHRSHRDFVSHWWSQDWAVTVGETQISVRGKMYPHMEQLSTPARHAVLRMMSFFLGSRLIVWLKSLLIFKAGRSGLIFHRTIIVESEALIRVEDKIDGLLPTDTLDRAPRASKRHVASADSFHREDFLLAHHFAVTEDRKLSDASVQILTTYRLNE